MKSRTLVFATCLMLLWVSTLTAQVPSKPGPPKPNGPVKKTLVPNKPPPAFATPKSDLAAGVSVYVDSKASMVVMEALITNYGPDALAAGARTLTLSIKHKGVTTSWKDIGIPGLKGTATTPGQQAGSTFTTSQSVPTGWGYDENTIYEVRISPSKSDHNPKNDVATQVGPNKGKP